MSYDSIYGYEELASL